MTQQSYGLLASGAQAHRIEVKLDAVLQLLGVVAHDDHLILNQGRVTMAKIEDIEADEAALKDGTTKLIHMVGDLLAELNTLKNNPTIPGDVQTKIDDLHQKFHADLADITAAISADGEPLNPADPVKDLMPPYITSVEPASGPAGTQVTITGRDLDGLTGVSFGGVPATVFAGPDAEHVTATVPEGTAANDLVVLVTTSQGDSNPGVFTVPAGQPVETTNVPPPGANEPAPVPPTPPVPPTA